MFGGSPIYYFAGGSGRTYIGESQGYADWTMGGNYNTSSSEGIPYASFNGTLVTANGSLTGSPVAYYEELVAEHGSGGPRGTIGMSGYVVDYPPPPTGSLTIASNMERIGGVVSLSWTVSQ